MQLAQKHFSVLVGFGVLGAVLFASREAANSVPPPATTERKVMEYRLMELPPDKPRPALADAAAEPTYKKINLNYGLRENEGSGMVRVKQLKLGADYRVSQHQTIGVETTQEFADVQDAQAWDKSPQGEQAASVKYKVNF